MKYYAYILGMAIGSKLFDMHQETWVILRVGFCFMVADAITCCLDRFRNWLRRGS